jgi:Zn-dependent peptidase ImmA (M78 family)
MSIDFSNITVPFLNDEEIHRHADDFRQRYWGNKLPIDVELIVERNLRLLIIPVPDLCYKAHTEAYLSGDLKEIVYDPIKSDVRVRFSIAHEVGHFILHKEIIKSLRAGTYEEWKEIQLKIPVAFWGRAEYQAREFAGRLLVPRDLLINELKTLQPLIEKARASIPDLEIPVIKEAVAPKLAKRFFVSDEVIIRRMDIENISPIQD